MNDTEKEVIRDLLKAIEDNTDKKGYIKQQYIASEIDDVETLLSE